MADDKKKNLLAQTLQQLTPAPPATPLTAPPPPVQYNTPGVVPDFSGFANGSAVTAGPPQTSLGGAPMPGNAPGPFGIQQAISDPRTVPVSAPALTGDDRQALRQPMLPQSIETDLDNAVTAAEQRASDATQRRKDFVGVPTLNPSSMGPDGKPIGQSKVMQTIADALKRDKDEQNSFGATFGRGYDLGQKIAQSLLVPIVGHFGGMGGAIAANNTVMNLQQQIALRDAQKAQEKHARNQLLLNYAQIADNTDPNSFKNLLSLATHNSKNANDNATQREKLLDDEAAAYKQADELRSKRAELKERARANQNAAILGEHSADVATAGSGTAINNSITSALGQKSSEEAQRDSANLRAKELQLRGLEDQQKQIQADKDNANKMTAQQLQAAQQAQSIAKDIHTKMAQTGMLGQAKYPDYSKYMKSDPAVRDSLRVALAAMGSKLSPEDYLNSLEVQAPPPPANGNPVTQLIPAIKKGVQDLLPGAPVNLTAPAAGAGAAAAATPPPPQFVASPQAQQALVNKNPTLIGQEFYAQALKAGKRLTPEELMKAVNDYENGLTKGKKNGAN